MENPIYISLSRMLALSRQMDVVSNNVANAATTGYKQQRMTFTEFLDKPTLGERVSLVQDRAVYRDMSAGPMAVTTNPLDVAINGKGYFVVDTVSGPRYTRAGRFQLDGKGQLVNNDGLPVLDSGDKPITIPTGTSQVTISADGSIYSNRNPNQAIGKLKLVTFEKDQLMTETGSGLFTTDEAPKAVPKDTKVAQGVIEESNVKSVVEMTNMIGVLRQYQGMQKIVDAEHDRQRNMIQKLARQA